MDEELHFYKKVDAGYLVENRHKRQELRRNDGTLDQSCSSKKYSN